MRQGTMWIATFVAALLVASPVLAGNPMFRCKPGTVDDDAQVVVYPDADVSIFSKPNEKTCTFALEGATPSGPSEPAKRVRWEDTIAAIESGDLTLLLVRLTAARESVDSGADRFGDKVHLLLKPYYADIASCFKALRYFDSRDQPPPKVTEGSILIFLNR